MMRSKRTSDRHGMTLIELLVVISIMVILVVAVAPNVAKNATSRRNREGARSVSTFVAKAQARAVGRSTWSGFSLVNTGAWMAFDLYMAETPAVFRGDTNPAALKIGGIGSSGSGTAAPEGDTLLATGTRNFLPADLIRFDGRGPFFEIVSAGTTTLSSGTIMVTFRLRGDATGAIEDAGFQPHNTPLPPVNVSLPFELLRRPVTSGSPLLLPDGVVVDLRWSGYGPPSVGSVTSTYRTFPASSTIYVLFDGTGRLRQVVEQTGATVTRRPVTGTVFLLVGRTIRAGNNGDVNAPSTTTESLGANWQYADSFWVAIDPMSGVTKTAECTPVNVSLVGTGTSGCLASQTWIRQALTSDGR